MWDDEIAKVKTFLRSNKIRFKSREMGVMYQIFVYADLNIEQITFVEGQHADYSASHDGWMTCVSWDYQ